MSPIRVAEDWKKCIVRWVTREPVKYNRAVEFVVEWSYNHISIICLKASGESGGEGLTYEIANNAIYFSQSKSFPQNDLRKIEIV